MRYVLSVFTLALMATLSASVVIAQQKPSLAPTPRPVTMPQLKAIEKLEGQLVQVTALVRHTDTAQVFTFGDKAGPEIHVIVPNPATDAAHVGDNVDLTGFVRRFSAGDFERDYRWFRRADYPDVHGGDWVIVATSANGRRNGTRAAHDDQHDSAQRAHSKATDPNQITNSARRTIYVHP